MLASCQLRAPGGALSLAPLRQQGVVLPAKWQRACEPFALHAELGNLPLHSEAAFQCGSATHDRSRQFFCNMRSLL